MSRLKMGWDWLHWDFKNDRRPNVRITIFSRWIGHSMKHPGKEIFEIRICLGEDTHPTMEPWKILTMGNLKSHQTAHDAGIKYARDHYSQVVECIHGPQETETPLQSVEPTI